MSEQAANNPVYQEIPDYNKIFNTPGGDYYNNEPRQMQPQPSMQPPMPAPNQRPQLNQFSVQHSPTANIGAVGANVNANNTADYGPLDSSLPMASTSRAYSGQNLALGTTTANDSATHPNKQINMSPFQAPTTDNSKSWSPENPHETKTNPARRRSTIGDFFNNVLGGDNLLRSSSSSTGSRRSMSGGGNVNGGGITRTSSTPQPQRRRSSSKHYTSSSSTPSSDKLGRRRSSAYLSMGYTTDASGDEHKGPYADVSRSQAQHMERIREAEKNLRLTHNKDGLPLPNEDALPNARQRRRSSIAHFFGLDKPLLAR
ncbi:hypothetical protein BG004_008343 [Podila humilis]|nr:hypothetical protein BG004_008343 [Podila humilis]